MDDKTLFTLLQNIIDQQSEISNQLKEFKEANNSEIIKHLDRNQKIYLKKINAFVESSDQNGRKFEKFVRDHMNITHKYHENLKEQLICRLDTFEPNKTINNEYSLFSSNSKFSIRRFLAIVILLFLIWNCFKYLPLYFSERSELKNEKEVYELFYNYIYLNEFKDDQNPYSKQILIDIKNQDSTFISKYNTLINNYSIEMKKQELRQELKSLEEK